MQYIKFPAEKFNEVSNEVLDELHLSPRKSVDGSQVIMKLANYERLFPSVMTLPVFEDKEPQIIYPYPTYEGAGLDELLNSPEWTAKE